MTIVSRAEADFAFTPRFARLRDWVSRLQPIGKSSSPTGLDNIGADSTLRGADAAPIRSETLRPLIIAEGANPELTSASLVGWSCAIAIAKITQAHIVTEGRNRDSFIRAGLTEGVDFTAISARWSQGTAWRLTKLLSGRRNFGWSLYAIFSNLAYPFFERAVWKHFATRIRTGEFDLVHRVLPLSPTTPSWLAPRLKRARVPFIIGPLNGGVPWPDGFAEIRRQESDWAGRLRTFYRFLPGHRQTRRLCSAIIAGARTTWRELPDAVHHKCVLIPENAIDPGRFPLDPKPPRAPGPLRIAFVGRLVALKGVDLLLDAAAPLLRDGRASIDIIGDGPEMSRLRSLADRLEVCHGVHFAGWLDHCQLTPKLRQCDVFAFPSIREFGGGAVLEAMALGLPPIVLDHGGPPELVPGEAGYVLPLRSRAQVIADLQSLLHRLSAAPGELAAKGEAARLHVRQHYTWSAKAGQITEVYRWVLGKRIEKPDWGMPFGFQAQL